MAATTILERTGKHEGTALVEAETVSITGSEVIQVHSPNAQVVHGHVSSSAAGTVTLQGSADGVVWFEDTASAVTSVTNIAFRFADRWAYYRLFCNATVGTVDIDATLVALTS